jgi:hypothetical protein
VGGRNRQGVQVRKLYLCLTQKLVYAQYLVGHMVSPLLCCSRCCSGRMIDLHKPTPPALITSSAYVGYSYVTLLHNAMSQPCRVNGSHIESRATEVAQPQASRIANTLEAAARCWWSSVVADPHSFAKPTFYLGLGGWHVTNMLAAGAHERTPGNVTLLMNGATGFRSRGDRMCFKTQVTAEACWQNLAWFHPTRAGAAD